ncbi:AraC family transcriptional regulator [Pseudactinotalea suaedae]|uniref:AraC family transcriptional regulator n=1 Tax=Pseudactinotalea suaedae TaxID=1524924 RepID=UPI0012E31E7B|nr:AraC family transcriptional regulator [Pseudactinotalea suaedae]
MELDALRALLERRTPLGTSEPLPGVFLSREPRPGVPHADTTGTTFALIVQGTKELRLGDQTVTYGPGEYLVTSIDLPVIGRYSEASTTAPALGFGMTLTAPAIAELLLSTGAPPGGHGSGRGESRPVRGERAVPALVTSRSTPELRDAVGRLVRLLDRPQDLPVLGPMVRREILWLLVTGPQGGTVRQLGLADSKLTRIDRVVQWIRDHAAEPIRVADLADRAGLSVSAFHRTFRAVTGSTPLQFQKQLRLATARQLLASQETSVTAAAYAVGYESAAQFNREYRRLFGTPPGRDRGRLVSVQPA